MQPSPRRVLSAAMLLLCLGGCQNNPEASMNPPLKPCPPSPNCVCSDEASTLHGIEPLRPTESVAFAWQALSDYLQAQPNVTIVTRQPNYLAAEFRTRILRFVDDVEFEARNEQGVIAMRSASRMGYSDLGANRHRLEKLRAALAAQGVVRAKGEPEVGENGP